jgi:hypothetical protein
MFYQKSNKISFAFLWIFNDFLHILQVSANLQHYWSYSFALRPLEVSADLRPSPYFAQNSPDKSQTLHCRPRAPAGGGPAKFRRTGGRDGPGAGGEWSSDPWGSIPMLEWVGRGPPRWGAGGQRRWPPRPLYRRGDGSVGETGTPASLGRCKGRWGEGLLGPAAGQNWSSPRQPLMAPAAARSGAGRYGTERGLVGF